MKLKLKISVKTLVAIKKCLTLVIIQLGPNKLAVGKMEDEAAGVAIEEIGGLNPKMYSYLVHDNSEHKKAKGVNRIFVSKIIHNE